MRPGLVSAGVRIARIDKAVEEGMIARYAESLMPQKEHHPLKRDIEAAAEYVEWLRFSGESPFSREKTVAERNCPSAAPQYTGASLPVASIGELLRFPSVWDGKDVIVECGEMVHASRESCGRFWNMLSDGTGRIAAVSPGKLEYSKGTLFGVARVTPAGGQPFLEIRNFYPPKKKADSP